ncbi:AAA family ATPase [Chryseobacterium viscerum]|uniref:Rad50/SbcC-type AAA domain-containing protein n=1 Tax=Chryseobacterium viscerum TaxID=1037377 RepID=A0A316WMQ2_9FLAO|nr:AAA family ATPase [Chryseobacterium viscerum]PWN59760.1 hypothetical protein C1634_017190 [Chryseobacterium viscerum]
MRFKRIEISGFRIYDDPKDATFNLTNESGDPVGFVSLYAPNGFGKTSFYDAVEYGMTKSINRFFIRNKEIEKLASFQRLQNEMPLLRNTKSPDERETFIKILTDKDDNPRVTKFEKHGNQIYDLNFKNPIEDTFQKVILSQEWISAFLTEQDGEFRYQKFMETPELSSINYYYNNLKLLHSELKARISNEEKIVDTNIQYIQKLQSNDILKVVNGQIQKIRELNSGTLLQMLYSGSPQEEIKELKDIIVNEIALINNEEDLREELEEISIAKNGNEKIIGLKNYFSLLNTYKNNHEEEVAIEDWLKVFDSLDKLKNQFDNNNSKLNEFIERRSELGKVIFNYFLYEKSKESLEGKQKEKNKNNIQKTKLLEEISILNRKKEELNSQIKVSSTTLNELIKEKGQLPQLKQDLKDLSEKIDLSEKEYISISNQLEEKKILYNSYKEDIILIEKITDNFINDIYPSISDDEKLQTLLEELILDKRTLSDKKRLLNDINIKINEQSHLNQSITDLISLGLDILNSKESQNCPLCDSAFDSYNILVSKISQNRILDDTLKNLFSLRNECEKSIILLNNLIESKRDNVRMSYEKKLNFFKNDSKTIEDIIFKIEKEERNILSNIKNDKEKKEAIELKFKNEPLQIYENNLNLDIVIHSHKNKALLDELDENQIDINKNKEQQEFVDSITLLIDDEIAQIENDDKHKFVVNYFNIEFPGKSVLFSDLEERNISLSTNIEELRDIQEKLNLEITSNGNNVKSLNKEQLIFNLKKLKEFALENNFKLDNYLNFLREKVGGISSIITEDILTLILDNRTLQLNESINNVKKLKDEYEKLTSYSDNIWPFLLSENSKKKVEKALGEIKFLTEIVEPQILYERDKARIFLQGSIESFFHENLINDLYKKIDPHPDFKSIEFKANFDTDNPRLDVFVRNVKDESVLIPNLYFSTAQINILSLSIFLASALNSKDYECIFIDDPIQSMDSINMLSTIDLLRSIVVNYKKQVILSTHDENFHDLLKKKMPVDLFNSKFLELETFGKVK